MSQLLDRQFLVNNVIDRIERLEHRLQAIEAGTIVEMIPDDNPGTEMPTNLNEGPDIDLVGSRIGRGGDTILVFHSNGDPVAEYTTLAEAVTDATSGDTIVLPSRTIAITAGVTLAAGVALIGMAGLKSKISLTGGSITLSGSNLLRDVWLDLTANDANTIVAIVDGGSGNEIVHCNIVATQAGSGNAYAVEVANMGVIICRDCYLEGAVSGVGVGYAGFWSDGNLYVIGGEVTGSVAGQPFNVL